VVFDYPTPEALAGYVTTKLSGDDKALGDQSEVLVELDRLETAIVGISPDDDLHAAIRARLSVMLSKVDKVRASESEDAAARLGSATDDEIYQFIHDELGRS
jgi:hypothetical protein